MLFASVLQCNKSMLSHWKDFRRFHHLLSGTQKTTCLPGHGPIKKKNTIKTEKGGKNPHISLQYCYLPHAGCCSNAEVSTGPIRQGDARLKAAHCLHRGGHGESRQRLGGGAQPDLTWPSKSRDKSSLPSDCPTLEQTAPSFQKSSRKGEEEHRLSMPGQSTQQPPERCPQSYCPCLFGSCCPECCSLTWRHLYQVKL